MSALDWYVTLALWKATVFMEGNYKRALEGSTDDPYLKTFGEGVLELSKRAVQVTRMASENGHRTGLLIDFGGVLTTSPFDSFRAFCETEGLDPETIGRRFREDRSARDLLIGLEEGKLPEEDFEARFAELLGVAAPGLIERLMGNSAPEPAMYQAVRRAHAAGIRTGLISNSWGTSRYDRELLAELFDGVVLSGEVRDPQAGAGDLRAGRAQHRSGAGTLRVRRRPPLQPEARAGAGDGDRPPHRGRADDHRARATARRGAPVAAHPAAINTTPVSAATTPSS